MKEGDKVTCNIKHKHPCLHGATREHPNGVATVKHVKGNSAYLVGEHGNIGSRGIADLDKI